MTDTPSEASKANEFDALMSFSYLWPRRMKGKFEALESKFWLVNKTPGLLGKQHQRLNG